jgi:hypothetical protein
MSSPIPPKFNNDFDAAVSSLTRAAHSYRSVLFLVVDAIGPEAMKVML